MRRIAAGVLAVLLLAAMVMPAWAETTDNGDLIVYCTLTGDCYHRAGCGSLRSRIEIRIADAVARGLAPCKHCNPPIYTGAPVPASPDRTSSAPSTRSVSGGTGVEVVHAPEKDQQPASAASDTDLAPKTVQPQPKANAWSWLLTPPKSIGEWIGIIAGVIIVLFILSTRIEILIDDFKELSSMDTAQRRHIIVYRIALFIIFAVFCASSAPALDAPWWTALILAVLLVASTWILPLTFVLLLYVLIQVAHSLPSASAVIVYMAFISFVFMLILGVKKVKE